MYAGDIEAAVLKKHSYSAKSDPAEYKSAPWVAIVGNPNSGKTALFNRLTGLHHKVGNYPGITVEKKSGWLRGHKILLKDFPGTYSLNAQSLDEKIVEDMVQSWREPANRPRAVIVVVDANNLSRQIYLALQILDWQIPTIVVLNMMDEVEKNGLKINEGLLKKRLNAHAVVPASAKYARGIKEIIDAIADIPENFQVDSAEPRLLEIERFLEPLSPLSEFLESRETRLNHHHLVEALRLLSEPGYINYMIKYLSPEEIAELQSILERVKTEFKKQDIPFQALEQASRYAFIDLYLNKAVTETQVEDRNLSERMDDFLTHRIFGPVILLIVLGFIFNAIFNWAQYPMAAISSGIEWISVVAADSLPDGVLKSLIIDGIISGVGSILVFFPQILLLVFFLSLLEDSGYMARMAFMMDRLMHKIGLHGKSVLPLLSGFACAIPAVMAARTIENRRDRLITIMIIPLMSCSARLPVYTLLIAAFIPNRQLLGFISLQAVVLMGIYFLGMFTSIFVSIIFKKSFQPHPTNAMLMEMPPYRMPLLTSLWWQIYERGKTFLVNAGSIILAISIFLWFLASYPKPDNYDLLTSKERLKQSYAGQIGQTIEPVIKPLGYDWKIGVGLLTSFAAREVIISTLATIYNLEEENTKSANLIYAMRKDRYPDGRPVFTTLVAISLMVFFAYAAQCMATFAVIKRETNSWRWPLIMVAYMTILAYLASLLVYQGGRLLGFS